MKTLCFSLLLAILIGAPGEMALASAPATAETTLATASPDGFGGAYKFKRKKRKKNRGPIKHKRHGLFGLGR